MPNARQTAPAMIAGLLCALLPTVARSQVISTPDTAAQVSAALEPLVAVVWVEERTLRRHDLFVHNRTDRRLVIRGYSVWACVGIQLHHCQSFELDRAIPAHGTLLLGGVELNEVIRAGFRYRFAADVVDPVTANTWHLAGAVGE